MNLERREFLKLVGTAAVASSAMGVVHITSASRLAVESPSGERDVPVMCNACGAGCGLLFTERNGRRYLLPNLEHPQPGMCVRLVYYFYL
jgi:anaerobic selenocysteine-containing dehydrogenase